MKHELRHVAPLRAANIMAVVYGILTGLMALIFVPFFLLVTILQRSGPTGSGAFPGPVFGVFMLIFYPVMGAVMGWTMGLAGAAIYNFIIRWTGGLLVDLQPVRDVPSVFSPTP
jgi:hypothetical protein